MAKRKQNHCGKGISPQKALKDLLRKVTKGGR